MEMEDGERRGKDNIWVLARPISQRSRGGGGGRRGGGGGGEEVRRTIFGI